MRLSKTALLGGVAALAFGVSTIGVTSQANAFNDVEWEWDLEINQTIDKRISIDVTFDPIGDITDQIMQIHLGDIDAESYVNGVYNDPIRTKSLQPYRGFEKVYEKEVDLEASLELEIEGEAEIDFEAEGSGYFIAGRGTLVPGPRGTIGGGFYAFEKEFELEAEIDVELEAELDYELDLETREKFVLSTLQYDPLDAAVELPEVASVATAVGNSISVVSENAMVEEHSLQIVADTVWGGRDFDGVRTELEAEVEAEFELTLNDDDVDSENLFHNLGIVAALAGTAGLLDKAEISADSQVYNIYNATVDSRATAVGNIKTIDLTVTDKVGDNIQGNFNDAVVLADITQVSIADISASSKVGSGQRQCVRSSYGGHCFSDGVNIYGYNNFAGLVDADGVRKPIVNSVATAIGNAVNITVGTPKP